MRSSSFRAMSLPADKSVLEEFAQRLHEVCDDMGLPKKHGRQTALAKLLEVTPKAARQWLNGEHYPEMPKAVRISNWGNVNVTWLLQGAGLKRGTRLDAKIIVLDEALHSLPPEQGIDVMDTLRAKLLRAGRLHVSEPASRYEVMLQAYERELSRNTS